MKRTLDPPLAIPASMVLSLAMLLGGAERAPYLARSGAVLERPGRTEQSHFQNAQVPQNDYRTARGGYRFAVRPLGLANANLLLPGQVRYGRVVPVVQHE